MRKPGPLVILLAALHATAVAAAETPPGAERVVLVTPHGSVAIDILASIGARPARQVYEESFQRLLTRADRDGDGKATWREAIRSSQFGLKSRARNEAQQAALARLCDTNRNELLEAEELKRYLLRFFQCQAFSVTEHVVGGEPSPDSIGALLDANCDGALQSGEIEQAATMLRRRDKTAKGWLQPRDLTVDEAVRPHPDWIVTAPVDYQIERPDEEGSSDANVPTRQEDCDASVRLRYGVCFGQADAEQEKIKFDVTSSGLNDAVALFPTSIMLGLPGIILHLAAEEHAEVSPREAALSVLRRFDRDGNGYLDERESRASDALAFASLDVDGDGKATLEEIMLLEQASQAPIFDRLTLLVRTERRSLLAALDQNADRRLGAREIDSAAERLAALDLNKDGGVTADEIPGVVTLLLTYGSTPRGTVSAARASGEPAGERLPVGPKWFDGMDQDQDGDITPQEFLGTTEQFQRLDKNRDGFVDLLEARSGDD